MIRRIIVISVFLFILIPLFSKDVKKDFRLIINLSGNPFIYENQYTAHGNALNLSIMTGIKFYKLTIGPEVYENYFSLNGKNNNKLLTGAWNIIRGTLNGYFEPVKWFEFSWGVGGAWFRSAFNYNNTGRFVKNEAGVSALFNIYFKPSTYVNIEFINTVDIFFNGAIISPYYYGGIRFNFRPGIDWMGLYVEAAGRPWIYNSEPVSILTGMFLWAVGVNFDLSFPKTLNYMKDLKLKVSEKQRERKLQREFERGLREKEKTPKETDIVRAEKAYGSGILYFYNAIFPPNSYILPKESIKTLNEVVRILKKDVNLNKNIELELKGYTNYTGNPQGEARLAKIRVTVVKNYLIKNGINIDSLRIAAYGGLYPVRDKIIESNRRVEIKIYRITK